MKNVLKQKHFSLNGESSEIEVLQKSKSFLKPCFLFVGILAGFAFGRRILDEHTRIKPFFTTSKTTKFSIKLFPVFKKFVYFKSEAIYTSSQIYRTSQRKKIKVIMLVKRDNKCNNSNSHEMQFLKASK